MNNDELHLLILHGLRLAGLASVEQVAAIHDLDPDPVGRQLGILDTAGLVAPARGDGVRWTLTSEGRQHGELLLAEELDGVVTTGHSGREIVTAAYHRFLDLNQPMLAICTRWQIMSRDPIVLNDHSDADHDAAVIAAVGEINEHVRPICVELETLLKRFRRYRPAFDDALFRLNRGETDWLTKPTVLSYHTVWFQLHEDLLATLGLERADEIVRLNSEPTTEPPEVNPGPTGTVG